MRPGAAGGRRENAGVATSVVVADRWQRKQTRTADGDDRRGGAIAMLCCVIQELSATESDDLARFGREEVELGARTDDPFPARPPFVVGKKARAPAESAPTKTNSKR